MLSLLRRKDNNLIKDEEEKTFSKIIISEDLDNYILPEYKYFVKEFNYTPLIKNMHSFIKFLELFTNIKYIQYADTYYFYLFDNLNNFKGTVIFNTILNKHIKLDYKIAFPSIKTSNQYSMKISKDINTPTGIISLDDSQQILIDMTTYRFYSDYYILLLIKNIEVNDYDILIWKNYQPTFKTFIDNIQKNLIEYNAGKVKQFFIPNPQNTSSKNKSDNDKKTVDIATFDKIDAYYLYHESKSYIELSGITNYTDKRFKLIIPLFKTGMGSKLNGSQIIYETDKSIIKITL